MHGRRIFAKTLLILLGANLMTAEAVESIDFKEPNSVDVAHRCLALIAVVALAHKDSNVRAWVDKYQIAAHLSKEEMEFFNERQPTEKMQFKFSWRAEALVPLLWALGHLPKMPPPSRMSNPDELIIGSGIWADPIKFVANAELRTDEEIGEAVEDAYDANWKVRDAQIFGKPIPDSIHPGVIQERHHGLNWLAGIGEGNWNTVPTDT